MWTALLLGPLVRGATVDPVDVGLFWRSNCDQVYPDGGGPLN